MATAAFGEGGRDGLLCDPPHRVPVTRSISCGWGVTRGAASARLTGRGAWGPGRRPGAECPARARENRRWAVLPDFWIVLADPFSGCADGDAATWGNGRFSRAAAMGCSSPAWSGSGRRLAGVLQNRSCPRVRCRLGSVGPVRASAAAVGGLGSLLGGRALTSAHQVVALRR